MQGLDGDERHWEARVFDCCLTTAGRCNRNWTILSGGTNTPASWSSG
jgi:hypothetical protein